MENINLNQPPQPPMPQPIKKWYKHIGLITVIILAFLAAILSWAYFNFNQPTNLEPVVVNYNPKAVVVYNQAATTTPVQILGDTFTWHPQQKISDQKLFTVGPQSVCNPLTFSYYSVGNVVNGPQKGGEILLANTSCTTDEGIGFLWAHFLRNGSQYTLLKKYSDDFTDEGAIGGNFQTDANFDIPDLNPPATISDPQNGAVLNLDKYRAPGIFDSTSFKYAFKDNLGVSVYQNKDDILDDEFYKSAPDGMGLYYEYIPSFFKPSDGVTSVNFSQLDLIWNDGKSHNGNYSYNQNIGCGQSLTEANVNSTDLTEVAHTTDGQNFYEFVNLNNPTVQSAQKLIQQYNSYSENSPISFSPDMIIFWTDPFGKTVMLVNAAWYDACGGKPVIYLYPTKPTEVSVKVSPAGGISKSEPAYANGWNVLAQPDGMLSTNGQQYPYLFWEGGLGSYQTPNKGFVVDEQSVKQLLNDKLSTIGLNTKEIADFEQFWLPKMQSAPYYFVTFTTNTEMEKYAPLTIIPRPDTVIRVLMDYRPLQNYETVTPLNLAHTDRNGFTVVEWGGVLK